MSLSTSSKRLLNTSRDGDSTTSLGSLVRCLTTLSVKIFFLISIVESDEVSPQPPFLQAEQPQVPQPLPISLVLQTLPQLRCPSLDTLQPLNVSLVVRGPTLNTAFEVRPHQCRAQGHGHCPAPAGHTIADTRHQDTHRFLIFDIWGGPGNPLILSPCGRSFGEANGTLGCAGASPFDKLFKNSREEAPGGRKQGRTFAIEAAE
ncbi:hypothetical protein QYF61_010567 [Mycteria americana]|uniref:Uncharacterized protein n=1 Tax=Mycteria americana TaxID=33587 RepID=A0AAN7RZH3_MYCAM|nr:hypothetical protein QYF61_010567 [Mycteria americana]